MKRKLLLMAVALLCSVGTWADTSLLSSGDGWTKITSMPSDEDLGKKFFVIVDNANDLMLGMKKSGVNTGATDANQALFYQTSVNPATDLAKVFIIEKVVATKDNVDTECYVFRNLSRPDYLINTWYGSGNYFMTQDIQRYTGDWWPAFVFNYSSSSWTFYSFEKSSYLGGNASIAANVELVVGKSAENAGNYQIYAIDRGAFANLYAFYNNQAATLDAAVDITSVTTVGTNYATSGWVKDFTDFSHNYQPIKNGDKPGSSPCTNTYFVEAWNSGTTFTGSLKRTLTSLPNGIYSITAYAFKDDGNSADFVAGSKSKAMTSKGTYETLTLDDIEVTNGTLTFGLDNISATWIGISEVHLKYLGSKSLYTKMLATANSLYNGYEDSEAKTTLKGVIDTHESSTAYATAYTALKSAVTTFLGTSPTPKAATDIDMTALINNPSFETGAAIPDMKTVAWNYNSVPGWTIKYDNGQSSAPENSQVGIANASSMISGIGSSFSPNDGANYFNVRNNWNPDKVYSIEQEVSNLPAGIYTVTCKAAQYSSVASAYTLSVSDGTLTKSNNTLASNTWTDWTVTILKASAASNLTIKASLTPGGANNGQHYQLLLDNFQLTYQALPEITGTYYLHNEAADQYFVGANGYGTQASLTSTGGLDVTIEQSDAVYKIDTKLNNGITNEYLGPNGYCDNVNTSTWTITPVDITTGGKVVYTLKSSENKYLAYDGSTTVLALDNATSDNAKWTLVTKAERIAALSSATAASPVDATFFIEAPNFGRNDLRISSWSGSPSIKGLETNMNAEKYNTTFDVYQDLSGMTNGIYKMEVQGFYRNGGYAEAAVKHNASTEQLLAKYYAGDIALQFKSIFEDAGETGNDGVEVEGIVGKFPDNQDNGSTAFSAGLYENDALYVEVADGTLRIGAVKSDACTYDWTLFDNFRLSYLGTSADAYALAYASAKQYGRQVLSSVSLDGYSEQSTLTSLSAEEATAGGSGVSDYQTAITAVKNAISDFNSAQTAAANLATARAISQSELAYASSSKYSAIATAQGAAAATSASDANTKSSAIYSAIRAYVESNAMAEGVVGATDYTGEITNALCPGPKTATDKEYSSADGWTLDYIRFDGGSGWTGSSTSHDVYYGSNGFFWGDFEGSGNSSLEQVVSGLPAGKYLLTVRAKSSGAIPTFFISGNGVRQNITHPNGVFGNGWDDTSVEFTVGSDGEATIFLKAQKESEGTVGHWFNADNFRLVRIGDLDAVALNENNDETSTIVAKAANVTLTRNISANTWSTFVVPFDIDNTTLEAQFGDDVSVSEFSADDKTGVTFTPMATPAITANKPVLLRVSSAKSSFTFNGVTIKDGTPTVSQNGVNFVGNYAGEITIPNTLDTYYVKSNALKKSTGQQKLKGFRAYFTVDADAPLSVKALFENGFNLDDTDAISDVRSKKEDGISEIFNLAGQKMSKLQKGVNIVNGKKVLVK